MGSLGWNLRQRVVKDRKERMHAGQETCLTLLSLPTPSWHVNIPVLAINGVAISRGVDYSEAKLHSSLFYLHS